jgi:hypothetical protein
LSTLFFTAEKQRALPASSHLLLAYEKDSFQLSKCNAYSFILTGNAAPFGAASQQACRGLSPEIWHVVS